MDGEKPIVLVIGAGPAGLTAALELIRRSKYCPVVVEASHEIGGISRTVNYKGYRMDIGGHRFFSKSDWVMNWWQEIMPIIDAKNANIPVQISYRQKHREVKTSSYSQPSDLVLLIRNRLSRIYYLRKFFDYPISLSAKTLGNLGVVRIFRIGISYCLATLFPKRPERSLEDFLINRFGDELYRTFFKDYTEKVWGVPCNQISAEWGAQRIKGLSIIKAIRHALSRPLQQKSIEQKNTSTSLIERFLYPKLGPGQLWEEVARRVEVAGGQILLGHKVSGVRIVSGRVDAVMVTGNDGGEKRIEAEHFISTMPIKDLVAAMNDVPPEEVRAIASELPYRDFVTVGLLVSRMKKIDHSLASQLNECPPDNWIYVQESDVKLGRIQVFNNWSPYLVADSKNVWLGLEYFCQEGDEIWSLNDKEMARCAAEELQKIGLIDVADVLDSHVVRVQKTYPAYFGAYHDFDIIRKYVDEIENLYLVGRNGMHRYNNQDHSMLTAKLAVDAIINGSRDKSAIWNVNIDDDYHEEK
ncbi:MAG TPA: NAD(P)/FAD-dependent oxidoreductase [Accumulibacter sp.]|jgi:protoporphyrinogen oxidase|nr:NAD(P)/FAD-dependent oxidoreductase [Accumulibacter sp.]